MKINIFLTVRTLAWVHFMNAKLASASLVLISLFLLYPFTMGYSQSTTIPSGSFIINMGVLPQTVANGLKPYGMVYDIVKNYQGSVIWAINPLKSKDGLDFSYGGVDYKGGTFIIPANYRTAAINTRITYWTGLGVVGVTSSAPITLSYSTTVLDNMPNWTLDKQNGSIAVNFFNYAGIPSSAYGGSSSSGWKDPDELNCCDDLFVMPHADPQWSTHGHLLDWNLTCKGGIWLGCHAGSALEDMFNPSIPSQQTNFLSTKTGTATGSGPYCQNALVLWTNHAAGSPPYDYYYPTDPIMQFMGTMDAAEQNGSEQIYMPVKPVAGVGGVWNPGARIYVSDPTQTNVTAGIITNGPAATLVSGRGFDNVNRGRVMMEAAHNISGSTTASVAAQRAFFNFSFYATEEKAQTAALSINPIPSTLYNGTPQALSYTFSGSGSYSVLWQSTCGGTFSPTATTASVTYYPPLVSIPTSCIISVTLTDLTCPLRSFTANQSVTIGCNLQLATTISNACYGMSNGSVAMNITGGNPTYNWTWSKTGGGSGSGSGTSITALSAGTYTINLTSNGGSGCGKIFTVTVNENPQIVVTPTAVNPACNGGSNGSISLAVSGGTPAYTYLWTGGSTLQNRSSLAAGTYNVTVTDSKACSKTATATLTQPDPI
ncbi:MAG: SprB repeat-containing protein, partial [Bacteroidales bacterium]